MNLQFVDKKVTGMLAILPRNEVYFDDEIANYNFPPEKSLRLKKIMGYNKHRIVEESTTVSDLCVFGLSYLFDKGMLDKEDIDAIILVTQTPDHFMPPTSNIIQGRLQLKLDMLCLDINQGCAGYLIGLMQAFMLLDLNPIRKVVLLNADVLSRKTSKKDRNSYPIIGDAAAITIIERDTDSRPIYANLKMDGSKGDALIIPAGGMKMPCMPETSILQDVGDNNLRSLEHLTMDGTAVFNFVQTKVPPMISELLAYGGITQDDVDYFMFHQPNKFMLQKLAETMKVPYEKMPSNIVENFGNASGVSIPTNIVFNLGKELLKKTNKLCIAGFGAGLTWSSMLLDLGQLNFCEMIEY